MIFRTRSLSIYLTFGFAALWLVSPISCRSAKRGVRAGGESVVLKAQLNGLQSTDTGHSDWTYEVSGCTQTVNGELDKAVSSGDVVHFKSASFKNGLLGCQLRIISSTPVVANAFGTITAEPNVIYWCRDFTIRQTADGELVAQVDLQKTYEVRPPQDKAFTLKVPVKFPAQETIPNMLATVECSPPISNPGIYPQGNPVTGDFTFAGSLEGGSDFKCTSIRVSTATKTFYDGSFAGTDGTFKATSGQIVTLKQVELKAQVVPDNSDPTVKVDVSPGTCADGEVYDAKDRVCRKK